MRTFFSFLKPHWRDAAAAPAMMALEVACDLAQPWCLSRVVDLGIRHGDVALALRYAAAMLALALTGSVGGVGCTVFASRASAGFGADLRAKLYAASLRLSFLDQSRFAPSTILNRLGSDVAQLQGIVLILLRILVRAPLLTIGGIGMILALDPVLGIRFLWPLPILGVVLGFVIAKSFPLFAKVQTLLDGMAVVVRENLSGVRVVKAFVRHREEIARFGKASQELANGTIAAQRIVGASLPMVQLMLNLSMVALIWFGGMRHLEGKIPLGQLMAMVNYLTQILFSLMMSAMMLMTVTRGKASLLRVREILDAAEHGDPAALRDAGHLVVAKAQAHGVDLAFRSVTFRYVGAGADSLDRISFDLRAGETLGVLGPTGAGKSTLIALVQRFADPSFGQILVDGMDLRERDLDAWRRKIGWVGQSPVLFTGTVRENILWGDPSATERDVEEAARVAQADAFVRELPEGYDTIIGQRGVNLSGGQRQRVAIARALVRKPSLLVLDDSTSALDGRTDRRLRTALAQALPNATRIVVAQRIASVADADKILLLDQGKVGGFGSHAMLLETNELYRDIWRSQTGSEVIA